MRHALLSLDLLSKISYLFIYTSALGYRQVHFLFINGTFISGLVTRTQRLCRTCRTQSLCHTEARVRVRVRVRVGVMIRPTPRG